MEALMELSLVFLMSIYLWASSSGRKWKARMRRIRQIHGPDFKIGYMSVNGKRSIRFITMESAKMKGQDWLITAWCHERKDFIIFHASRMYEFTDLRRNRFIRNVPAYFNELFAERPKSGLVRVDGQNLEPHHQQRSA